MKIGVAAGCLVLMLSGAECASAAVLTETFTGFVTSGVDGKGLFGDAGASLAGKAYTASFTYDTLGGALIKFGDDSYGSQQLYNATTVAFSIDGHTQVINDASSSITEHDTFYDYGYRSSDGFGPASIATDDVYDPETGNEVSLQVVLKNQSIPFDLSKPYTADFSDGIDSQEGFFNFPGGSPNVPGLEMVRLLAAPGASTSGTLTVTSLSASIGGGPVPNVPLPASAPMFGAGLIAFGVAGYGVRRRKNAASA